MKKELEEKINQLSQIEQNMQQLLSQRQQFQAQLLEIESALTEIEKSSDCYKIIGSIMVKADNNSLKQELSSKKEFLSVRVSSVEKQEDKLRAKQKELQKEVLDSIENEKDKN